MKCPQCKEADLKAVLTKQGVEVDFCPRCRGIWLDKGELYYFTKKPKFIRGELERGIKAKRTTARLSPKTGEAMEELPLLGGALRIDRCPKTDGLWFDGGELEKLLKAKPLKLGISIDERIAAAEAPAGRERVDVEAEQRRQARLSGLAYGLAPLPNLVLRSVATLTGLYGILILVLILCVEFTELTPLVALIIGLVGATLHFLLGPFMMDLSLRFFYKMSWVRPEGLPEHLGSFVDRTCKQNKMNFPRVGLIHDGAPNAFTYGHHPNNARIVFTRGLMDLLDERELEAVVAHEIGHAKHWDMLIMTLAQLVPLILYVIYRTLIQIRVRGRDKSAPYRYAIALGAFVLYIISEYIVLWFSRTREYFADRFAGEVTKEPNALASALVKIGYGLAGQKPAKKEKEEERRPSTEAIGALGIFDAKSAMCLAVAGYPGAARMGGEVNKDALMDAMKWDLWNPWAKYYELHSTHPLVANRLNYLSDQSAYLGKEPYVVFNRVRPESYWDEFLVDLGVKFLPLISILVFAGLYIRFQNPVYIGGGVLAFGASLLVGLLFSYRQDFFPEMNVAGLLKKVKVSSVRPVPCTLTGKVIGRGVPGLIWSEDFVLQDETGIIFLDYRQPLRILEFLFGLLRAKRVENKKVTISGWYRRAPVPYIELKALSLAGKMSRCYVYHMKFVVAVLVMAAGLLALLAAL